MNPVTVTFKVMAEIAVTTALFFGVFATLGVANLITLVAPRNKPEQTNEEEFHGQ